MRAETRARLERGLAVTGGESSDFDLNPDTLLPEGRRLRAAGVLIPLIDGESGLEVILTKRSAHLRHHPGQIAFPGGGQDPGDPTPRDAALREAEEEIGLPRGSVEILGPLPPHETVTGFTVTPFVGYVAQRFDERPEAGEVDEIFRVPFDFVTESGNFRIESRNWQGRRRHYFTVPYGPYYIWGATARILRGLSERLSRCG